jgi:transcription antitermination factor NusG
MPTFIFARSDRLGDLARVARDVTSVHPAFSIFRHQGRYPLVADRDLSQLRRAEERADVAVRRKRRRSLVMGQRVSFSDGAFAGIEGVVEEQQGQFAVVAFGGGFRMKIATWRDEFDDVEHAAAHLGAAA